MRHVFSRTKSRQRQPAPVLLLVLLLPLASAAAEVPARFTGSPSCATSMCHGGAGELRHQTTIWQKQDIHSRTYNSLVNARSAQIAAALKIPDATTSSRCTTCHAPFHEVPKSAFLADIIKPTEGVSCESCHGPAEKWIRSHTRPDFSHKDRVLLGLRDLNHLYVRANSCVACHQTVDPALLAAELEWSHALTRQALQRLAATHTEFADANIPRAQQARRAERLVLALDRLTAPLEKAALAKLEPDLKELFTLAQSLPDFAPEKFAKTLEAFAKKL